jgi:hypothetical protein
MALPRGDGSSGEHQPAATQPIVSGTGQRPSYGYSYPSLYYQPVYVEPFYRRPVRGRAWPLYGPVTGMRRYAL